jgi:hypothetical protein
VFVLSLDPPETFWIPLVAGAAGAVVVAFVIVVTTKVHARPVKGKRTGPLVSANRLGWWTGDVFTPSTWSFKDSWATNITAFGAVLGVITGTTNPLQSLAPTVPSYPFVILGLLFGGTVALSPLVYAALAKSPSPDGKGSVNGSVGGLLISSTVTLFATFGELSAIAVFLDVSAVTTGERWLLIGALSAAALFVALYAIRSFRALVKFVPSGTKHASSLLNSSGVSATL